MWKLNYLQKSAKMRLSNKFHQLAANYVKKFGISLYAHVTKFWISMSIVKYISNHKKKKNQKKVLVSLNKIRSLKELPVYLLTFQTKCVCRQTQ